MAERTSFFFVDAGDLADPEVVQAIATLRREEVKTDSGKRLEVVTMGTGQPKPPNQLLIVVPKAYMGKPSVFQALDRLRQCNNVILRPDSEVPTGSEEAARERGFTEEEITQHLRPWIGEAHRNAQAAVDAAQKALDAALLQKAAVTTAPNIIAEPQSSAGPRTPLADLVVNDPRSGSKPEQAAETQQA
jgi:hypothetical protein